MQEGIEAEALNLVFILSSQTLAPRQVPFLVAPEKPINAIMTMLLSMLHDNDIWIGNESVHRHSN